MPTVDKPLVSSAAKEIYINKAHIMGQKNFMDKSDEGQ